MLKDSQYLNRPFRNSELPHQYGDCVHLLNDPYLFTLLAQFGHPNCKGFGLHQILRWLYSSLLQHAVNCEFPQSVQTAESRMATHHAEGKFSGAFLNRDTPAVCVSLARAGIQPSQTCYEALSYLLDPDVVRQDHISINRAVDSAQHVVGTHLGGAKIGGKVDGAILLIPDPMGATGSTIKSTLEIYKKYGTPAKVLALHLIVTPEYIKQVTSQYPDIRIYAIRLDRGLSPSNILKTPLGSSWDSEVGLNSHQYIVPGAGGIGEVLNNSFV